MPACDAKPRRTKIPRASPSLLRWVAYCGLTPIFRRHSFVCSRCPPPPAARQTTRQTAPGTALRYVLRVTVAAQTVVLAGDAAGGGPRGPRPLELALFGNGVQWLFGGPPARFAAKVAALRASRPPGSADDGAVPVAIAATDPLVHVALQQCLIGEVFRFTGLREARRDFGPARALQRLTAEAITPVSAGPYETVLSVCVYSLRGGRRWIGARRPKKPDGPASFRFGSRGQVRALAAPAT